MGRTTQLRPLDEAPDFISPRDVPLFLPLCANSVYAGIADGTIPAVRFRRLLFVPKSGLEAMAAEAVAAAAVARKGLVASPRGA